MWCHVTAIFVVILTMMNEVVYVLCCDSVDGGLDWMLLTPHALVVRYLWDSAKFILLVR